LLALEVGIDLGLGGSMKQLLILFLFITANLFAGEPNVPTWYNREMLHNAVHDLEEVVEGQKDKFKEDDSDDLKAAHVRLRNAVDVLHTHISNADKEKDAEGVRRVFSFLEQPYEAVMSAARANQVRLKQDTRFLYDSFDIMDTYHRVKYWLTPTK
jgi:hypothetical protein